MYSLRSHVCYCNNNRSVQNLTSTLHMSVPNFTILGSLCRNVGSPTYSVSRHVIITHCKHFFVDHGSLSWKHPSDYRKYTRTCSCICSEEASSTIITTSLLVHFSQTAFQHRVVLDCAMGTCPSVPTCPTHNQCTFTANGTPFAFACGLDYSGGDIEAAFVSSSFLPFIHVHSPLLMIEYMCLDPLDSRMHSPLQHNPRLHIRILQK
jgi:hypothetical protein